MRAFVFLMLGLLIIPLIVLADGSKHHNSYYTYPEIPYIPVTNVTEQTYNYSVTEVVRGTVLGIATDHHFNLESKKWQGSLQGAMGNSDDTESLYAVSFSIGKSACLPSCNKPMFFNAAVGYEEGGYRSIKGGGSWEF